jgi:hypothetical protein
LKGPSGTATATTATTDTLCFRCHDATQYADASKTPTFTILNSGFSAGGNDSDGVSMANLHQRHAYYTSTAGQGKAGTVWPAGAVDTYRCTMCHTGTAHGWKNKAFLVNLNDVGPEVDMAVPNGTVGGALGGEISPASGVLATSDPVPPGTQVPNIITNDMAPVPTGYTNGPYYRGALLYINGFQASGAWARPNCANAGCH